MRTYEAVAKSADEAIEEILKVMGVSIEDLDIEIDEAGKGIFGFLKHKQVRVIATLKDGVKDVEPELTAVKAEKTVKGQVKTEGKAPVQKSNRDEVDPIEDLEPASSTSEITYTDPAVIIKEFIGEIASSIKEDIDVKVREFDEVIEIDISGDELSILIGRHGRTLESMRYLLTLMINRGRKEGEIKRIKLDIEGYRKKRDQQLERLARSTATSVIKSGRECKLEPMNPYERRVIHSILQRNKLVATRSEGEEPERCVVVFKK